MEDMNNTPFNNIKKITPSEEITATNSLMTTSSATKKSTLRLSYEGEENGEGNAASYDDENQYIKVGGKKKRGMIRHFGCLWRVCGEIPLGMKLLLLIILPSIAALIITGLYSISNIVNITEQNVVFTDIRFTTKTHRFLNATRYEQDAAWNYMARPNKETLHQYIKTIFETETHREAYIEGLFTIQNPLTAAMWNYTLDGVQGLSIIRDKVILGDEPKEVYNELYTTVIKNTTRLFELHMSISDHASVRGDILAFEELMNLMNEFFDIKKSITEMIRNNQTTPLTVYQASGQLKSIIYHIEKYEDFASPSILEYDEKVVNRLLVGALYRAAHSILVQPSKIPMEAMKAMAPVVYTWQEFEENMSTLLAMYGSIPDFYMDFIIKESTDMGEVIIGISVGVFSAVIAILLISLGCLPLVGFAIYWPNRLSMKAKEKEIELFGEIAEAIGVLSFNDISIQRLLHTKTLTTLESQLKKIVINLKLIEPYIPKTVMAQLQNDEDEMEEVLQASNTSLKSSTTMRSLGSSKISSVHQLESLKRQKITTMLVDIEKIHELDGDLVVLVHSDITNMILNSIKKYGGVLQQVQGDHFFISFNAVRKCFDHSLRAVNAAEEIQMLVRRQANRVWKTKVVVNIAIVSASMKMGDLGSQSFKSFSILSPRVTFAYHLVKHNKTLNHRASRILVDDVVYQAIEMQSHCEIVDIVQLTENQSLERVYCVRSLKNSENNEWMYVVDELESQNLPHTNLIALIWNCLIEGRYDDALTNFKNLQQKDNQNKHAFEMQMIEQRLSQIAKQKDHDLNYVFTNVI